MFLIFITDIFSLLVILQIIVTLSHSDTTLIGLYDIHGTVHIICTYEHGEVRTDAFLLALCDICIDFSFILESVNGCQFCFDRSYTFLVQLHAIHCDIIKIAYFLRSTARCVIFLRCQFGNQCFQLFTTVFAQHIECTET